MAKKSRKTRKGKGKASSGKPGNIQPGDILRNFKAHWKAGEWEQSLISYRRWCNKVNKKREPLIEGELLFRFSSLCYSRGQYEEAAVLLKEAGKVNPENRKHSRYCMGIALARSGQLAVSKDIFTELDNLYHKDIITSFLDGDKTFPENMSLDPPFQQDMILKFWHKLKNPEADPASSNALNNLKDAYTLFSSGKDPSSKLKLLESKTGFKNIADYLKLLTAVSKRRNIQIRNLLKKDQGVFSNGKVDSMLELHLKYLLKEQNYKEIIVLNKLLPAIKAAPPSMDASKDTALFYLGFKEIEQGEMEKALDYYRKIKSETPSVLHNKALLLQKLENFDEANECWTALCRKNKKPRRSDSEDLRSSYGIMLKYIAGNYQKADMPDKALSLYKEVLSLIKEDRDSLESLYEIYSEDNKHQLALKYAKQLFEIDRRNDEYLFNYASELLELYRVNELIPLYKEALNRNPESKFYKEGLEFCYVKSALEIKGSNLDKLKEFIEKIESLGMAKSYNLHYFKGYVLQKEGFPRKAMKKINKAIAMVEEHYEEFNLACMLYEDGFTKQSVKLFRDIASCGCPTSDMLTEDIIGFFIKKNDRENARNICKIAQESLLWDNYTIANIFYMNKQASWAVEFSLKLIKQENADKYDRYFHLLVLNAIGKSRETLDYAKQLLQYAENSGDDDVSSVYKHLIKEINTRGKFKPTHEY